ncbi:MAG: SDR family NAD(P)-dependent oxidoreductase [Chloroflexia bacterium]
MSEQAGTPRRVALVTGGSRGIGAATALALAQREYDVIITYRNKAARAEEVVAEIAGLGRAGLAIAADMTQADALAQLFARVAEWGGQLDLLVLNASGGLERDIVAADPYYPLRLDGGTRNWRRWMRRCRCWSRGRRLRSSRATGRTATGGCGSFRRMSRWRCRSMPGRWRCASGRMRWRRGACG